MAVEAGRRTGFLDAVRADPRIDVALVDIRMPVLDGLAATRALAAVPHAPAVIVVTTFDDDAYVLDAIAAGARGFLLKRCSGRELVDAVRTVAAGDSILSAEVTGAVLDRVRAHPGRPRRPTSRPYDLTAARARGPRPGRRRPQQHRDRGPPPPVDEHGEDPRHQRARQDRQPRPGAGRDPGDPGRAQLLSRHTDAVGDQVIEALQVGAFVLIAIAAVFASLFFVWRDDHKWLDRPRY